MKIGQNFLVEVSHSTVSLLMSQRLHDAETIDQIIERHFDCAASSGGERTAPSKTAHVGAPQEKRTAKPEVYKGDVLGRHIHSYTLASFFAEVVDTIDEVAPEVVVDLAKMRARTRAYVARTRAAVHGGRTDVPTRKTSSGWYISDNIGTKDLIRALRALCQAAGLTYGRDIRFFG